MIVDRLLLVLVGLLQVVEQIVHQWIQSGLRLPSCGVSSLTSDGSSVIAELEWLLGCAMMHILMMRVAMVMLISL